MKAHSGGEPAVEATFEIGIVAAHRNRAGPNVLHRIAVGDHILVYPTGHRAIDEKGDAAFADPVAVYEEVDTFRGRCRASAGARNAHATVAVGNIVFIDVDVPAADSAAPANGPTIIVLARAPCLVPSDHNVAGGETDAEIEADQVICLYPRRTAVDDDAALA